MIPVIQAGVGLKVRIVWIPISSLIAFFFVVWEVGSAAFETACLEHVLLQPRGNLATFFTFHLGAVTSVVRIVQRVIWDRRAEWWGSWFGCWFIRWDALSLIVVGAITIYAPVG
jgi:hypothetical protein